MALINELIKKIADPVLKERINTELERLNKQKKFGLVFEDHVPEYISLHEVPVLKGSKVTYRDNSTDQTFIVLNIDGEKVRCINRETKEIKIAEISELVTIAEFGDPIYPYLKKIDFIKNNPESDLWHILIEADNYHALQLLEYVYSGKIDCIYIDPPYNSGASDWKYNNNYVDKTDAYKHSKWLSMLEKRLRLSKRLLNPKESVLICTIDEKEYHHLGCLLEEVFPEAKIQMLTNVINPKGVARDYGFSRVEEYIYIVYVGTQTIQPGIEDMLREKNDGGKPVRWASLQRSGSNSRRFEGPTMFYPIFFNKDDKSFHSTGESLPLNLDRNTVIAPEGTIAVFPLGRNNDERNWQLSHVETCVLLSHKSADDFISVKMEYADDRKIQPDRITYRLIQEYIEEKYGFKVHTANIAEVKRNLGLPMYDAPNAVEELKRPYKPAPEYKVEAIKDALRHFKVID
ncbi:DNA methyltransferase [Erysipelothrix rhusiopathiae]|uniref:DNA methyltransferase n=1 Tax=Erysipelothrix rhusiopathiae TaxID=1648 RepID=UPI0039F06958